MDKKKIMTETLLLAALTMAFTVAAEAQLLKKNDYAVGVTVAIYQFDAGRSKDFGQVTPLKQTSSSPEEEIDYMTRNFGAEEIRFRHVRTIGLGEGESFTDSQPMNGSQLTFSITPRLITKNDVTFEFVARYKDRPLLEVKSFTVNNYETVMLRGGEGDFGLRQFAGPEGNEEAPARRALLVTITPSITTTRSLANKPSDISRPTDQFGSKVVLNDSDIFIMPALIGRVPLNFPPGAEPAGSITIEGIITPEGRVTNVKVLDTPDPALKPKAIEAFRQYRFSPAKLNGRPTYATYRETIVLGKQKPL